jgi:tagatose-6-phosphate ketose/aldose isomerase
MNPLSALLNLSAKEKERQGLLHTPQEIAHQKETWQQTWNLLEERLPAIRSFLESAGIQAELKDRPTVFLIGAGTSDYIGRSLHHLLRQRWQCEVHVVPSTDLLIDFSDYILPGQRYLWLSFSRSGDSPEGVAVLQRALSEYPQISHLVVSCNESGRMVELIQNNINSLAVLLPPETNDVGLAMTSSFTNMVIAGQALAHVWSPQDYAPVLQTMCATADTNYQRVCFIGSALLAGVARESALKVLELTAGNIKTMFETTLGLRHGPMAALDHETLFVLFLSTDIARQRYEKDLLHEIEQKQLVGASVAVLPCGEIPKGLGDTEIVTAGGPPIPDLYRPPLDVLFGQLLGLFFSLRCGLTPDTPSPNGAISRVVQPIEIY